MDTELVYAYAKVGQTGQLEEFISGTHQANLQACGDRCAAPPLPTYPCCGRRTLPGCIWSAGGIP